MELFLVDSIYLKENASLIHPFLYIWIIIAT